MNKGADYGSSCLGSYIIILILIFRRVIKEQRTAGIMTTGYIQNYARRLGREGKELILEVAVV